MFSIGYFRIAAYLFLYLGLLFLIGQSLNVDGNRVVWEWLLIGGIFSVVGLSSLLAVVFKSSPASSIITSRLV
eukprot:ANDGO_04916.mRNA.1 hypothetical protein